MAEDANELRFAAVDRALSTWRQGDLALEEQWFVQVGDGSNPLSEAAAGAGPGVQALTITCDGLVIVTQTCDLVRKCAERPYVEVAPLRQVSEAEAREAAKGIRPALGPIAVSSVLVADLDRTMTVEKSVVASWKRTPGWNTDDEIRKLAQALARKRERFAFPNDFVGTIARLRNRILDKHGRNSDEGRALELLEEIRVTAAPSWDAAKYETFITFIRPDATPGITDAKWAEFVGKWLALCAPTGSVSAVEGVVMPLSGLTALEYRSGDRLDLDHLSDPTD